MGQLLVLGLHSQSNQFILAESVDFIGVNKRLLKAALPRKSGNLIGRYLRDTNVKWKKKKEKHETAFCLFSALFRNFIGKRMTEKEFIICFTLY